jgi:hypothetical protein
MRSQIQERPDKFRELILYICEKCAFHQKFGAVKLNKILFYSDFSAYRNFGQPITGMEYFKLPKGPAPRRLLPIQREMQTDGDLVIQQRALLSGRAQRRPINLRKANLSLFTAQEISLVDDVIEAFRTLTADQISEISHDEIGWRAARLNETIPYETVFIAANHATALDSEKAAAVEQESAGLLKQCLA